LDTDLHSAQVQSMTEHVCGNIVIKAACRSVTGRFVDLAACLLSAAP